MNHRSRLGRSLCLLGVVTIAAGAGLSLPNLAAAATPPEPTYASATVDGSTGEWAPSDQWGTIVSNDPPHRAVAAVALRYDCDSGVLFVLVMASPGERFQTIDPAEAYVRLGPHGKLVSGQSGNDGVAPDFSWVDRSGDTAIGFEASALVEPGAYPASLRIHGKLPDDSADGYETVDLQPRYHDLTLTCVQAVTTTTALPAIIDAPTSTTIPVTTTEAPTSTTSSTSTTTSAVAPESLADPTPVLGQATDDDPPVPDPPAAERASAGDPPAVQPTELPRTGASTGLLAIIGAGLLLTGGVLVLRSHALRAME